MQGIGQVADDFLLGDNELVAALQDVSDVVGYWIGKTRREHEFPRNV